MCSIPIRIIAVNGNLERYGIPLYHAREGEAELENQRWGLLELDARL